MKVDLPFLMATDIPVNNENMEMFEKVFVTLIIFECTTKDVDTSHLMATKMPIDPVSQRPRRKARWRYQ